MENKDSYTNNDQQIVYDNNLEVFPNPVYVKEPKKKKGSSTAVVVLSVSLVMSLLLFASGCIFVYFQYMRPTVDIPTNTPVIETGKPTESETQNTTNPLQPTIQSPLTGDVLSTEEINEKVGPATVSILAEVSVDSFFGTQTGDASGSGFIISSDGYIVTNNHVITGQTSQYSKNIRVRIPGYPDEIPATLVGSDATTDIAVLKVELSNLPYVELGNSSELRVGERAVVIGNPLGSFEGTVTQGVISATERLLTIENKSYNLLQTDASINSGNSGGPLLNSRGQVVGVTNAKISSAEGIGFAIPIDDVKPVIKDLMEKGYVTGRPIIGILTDDITEEISRRYGLHVGVYISEVNAGSPAEAAGLQMRDIIIAIDGETVTTNSDIVEIRDNHAVGDVLIFTVVRGTEEIDLALTLGESRPTQ